MKIAISLFALSLISLSSCYSSFVSSLSYEREVDTAALEIIRYSINNFDRDFDKAISILQVYKTDLAKTPKALRTVDQLIGSVENYRDIEVEVDSGNFDGKNFEMKRTIAEPKKLHGILIDPEGFAGGVAIYSSLRSDHTYVGSQLLRMPEIDENTKYQLWLYRSTTKDWFSVQELRKSPNKTGQFEINEMVDENLSSYDKSFVSIQNIADSSAPDEDEILLEAAIDRDLIRQHIREIEDDFRK